MGLLDGKTEGEVLFDGVDIYSLDKKSLRDMRKKILLLTLRDMMPAERLLF